MILANYTIRFGDNKNASRMHQILVLVTRRVRYIPGCLESDLWMNDEKDAFRVTEIWKTRTDYRHYVNSTIFKHFLAAMEMGTEKPAVHITECRDFRGIEMIEEVMNASGVIPEGGT